MILPNKRFADKAIRMIEAADSKECLCELTFDEYGKNAESMATDYGLALYAAVNLYEVVDESGKIVLYKYK